MLTPAAPRRRKDAFTSKPISQQSLAYEKASVIFNIAATLSSLASRSSRLSSANADAATSDGLKLAFLSLRQSAGMLSYINDNFLHAPSTDMSKDVVRWLIDLMIAQAHEVLWEKTVGEGKGNSLSAKLAASAADRYAKLEKDAKDWVGKGILNKSWASLVAVSAPARPGCSQRSDAFLTHVLWPVQGKVLCIQRTVLPRAGRRSGEQPRLVPRAPDALRDAGQRGAEACHGLCQWPRLQRLGRVAGRNARLAACVASRRQRQLVQRPA